MGVKSRRHLKVDAVLLLFGERGKFILQLISNIIFLLFCLIITYQGTYMVYVMQFVKTPILSCSSNAYGFSYASVPVGAILMSIRLIQDTILLFNERKKAKS